MWFDGGVEGLCPGETFVLVLCGVRPDFAKFDPQPNPDHRRRGEQRCSQVEQGDGTYGVDET